MTSLSIQNSAQQPVDILEPIPDNIQATVSLAEVFRMGFDSLLANKVRSLLTMLGVIIGVASVVALLALGAGASGYITGQVSAIGTNVLTVTNGGGGGPGGPGNGGSVANLTLADSNAIAALKLPIIGPSPQFGGSSQVIAPAADTSAQVTGIEPAYQEINTLTLAAGNFLSANDVKSASQVVVLGNTLATTLFGSGEAVGQTVRIKGSSLRVIGVLNAKGSGGFGSVDDQALVPITTAQQRLFGGRTADGNNWRVSQVGLSVPDSANIEVVQARVEALLRERHNKPADGSEDDFRVLNQASLLSTLTTITSAITAFLAVVAGISLLVGGIGIMNIMLVSVTERTREIGLRKAVGARSGDILLQFLIEALVISLAGGLIGLVLGSIAPVIVTMLGLLNAPVTLTSALVAVGFSVGVGLFFGIWPARRAARLNPIQALRFE